MKYMNISTLYRPNSVLTEARRHVDQKYLPNFATFCNDNLCTKANQGGQTPISLTHLD